MNKTTKYLIIFILFLYSSFMQAQERLTVSTTADNNPCVQLKWVDEKIIYPEGIVVYRTDASGNERMKLTTKPIKKGDYKITDTDYALDSTLAEYVEIINSMKAEEFQGVISAMMLVKALQNNVFAKYAGMMYEDCEAKKNSQYIYEVYQIKNGKEVLIEKSPAVEVRSFVSDRSPDSLAVTAADAEVFIKWRVEEKRFWAVNIYRQAAYESDFRILNPEPVMISMNINEQGGESYPEIFFNDKDLRNGVEYAYKITGIDFFARETEFSEVIKVTPKDKTPPLPPTNLKAKNGLMDIQLTWNCDFKSADLKGYYVYRSKGRNGELLKINEGYLPIESTSYSDTVEEAGTYHYFVASVDSSGNEAKSFRTVIEILDIFPPKPPTNFQAVADTGRMILAWTNPTAKDFAGCRIFRTVASDDKESYTLLNLDLIKDTIFIDILPKNVKTSFYYKIAALDSSLNMSAFTDSRHDKMPDIIPPAPPFLKDITQENEALVIRWEPSSESDLQSYIIYRYETKDSSETLMRLNRNDLAPTTNLFTDRMLRNRTEYAYYMIAVDSSGNQSQASAIHKYAFISQKTDGCMITLDVKVKQRGKKVKLSWQTDEEDLNGFMIYRRTFGSDEFVPVSAFIQEQKYTDRPPQKEQRYEYQVRAYSTDGQTCKSNAMWVERKK